MGIWLSAVQWTPRQPGMQSCCWSLLPPCDVICSSSRHVVPLWPQVRKYMKTIIKPGIPLIDMCETLESTVRKLIDERGLDAGALAS
eukprot:1160304-Pelagomonas_calceolata.AAC.3